MEKKHKIYSKKPTTSRLHYDFSQTHYPAGSGETVTSKTRGSHALQERELDVEAEADRLILKLHAPVGVVINSAMEVVQFRGRTTPYLEPAPGKPTLNVLKLARNGLALELRSLIAAARKKNAPAEKNNISLDGHKTTVNISVSPLGNKDLSKEERHFLVLFEDVTRMSGSREVPPRTAQRGAGKDRELARLNQELTAAQDSLRAAAESEDAVREEFQSANEEILSANEELQSTNEELETSKEELQSANEELSTLNHELSHKNAELHDLNNDLSNFLNSTKIPVVMLDRNLRIRRLTPSADQLVKAVSSDVGRPIADIRLNVKVPDLEEMIAKVVDDLQPAEREVQDLRDHWHRLHILPYRTLDNKIDGVVLVLVDIDAMKNANEQLRHSAEFFHGIIDTVREPLVVLDAELRVIAVNGSFQNTFKIAAEQAIHQSLFKLGQWNVPGLRVLLEEVLSKQQPVADFEMEHDFENIGPRRMLLNARTLFQTDARQPMILLAIEDITDRRQSEERAMNLQQRIEQQWRIHSTTLSSITDFAYTFDREGRFLYANQPLLDMWDLNLEEAVGKNFSELPYPEDLAARLDRQVQQVFATGQKLADEIPYTSPRGVAGYYEYILNPVIGADGTVELVVGSTRNLTERKLAEAALIKSEKLAASGRLAAALAHEINNPLQAITNLMALLGHSPQLDLQDQEYARLAMQELDRVAHLVRQSLGFYRESTLPSAMNMQEVLEGVLTLYRRHLEEKRITVTKWFRLDGPLESYPGDIRQVFSTLLLNAIDAMNRDGRLVLRVSQSLNWRKSPPVDGVRITLADNGTGISADNRDRIFEPFFTTKGDRGTGLGLWVAQEIMQRLGGSIQVRSTTHPGKSGTCFTMFFPHKTPRTA